MIDYLQKVRPSGVSQNAGMAEKMGVVVKGIKSAAMTTRIPWIVPSQLSRDVAKGGTLRRPNQSDLRESGDIEQEADNIVFIHREDYANAQAHKKFNPDGSAELIVSKQRNGATGTAILRFVAECTRFEDDPDNMGPER